MNPVVLKLIDVTPFIVAIGIIAYIIEEVLEDLYSETLSDFVYPIAGLLILGIIWYKVLPVLRTYLTKEPPAEETKNPD